MKTYQVDIRYIFSGSLKIQAENRIDAVAILNKVFCSAKVVNDSVNVHDVDIDTINPVVRVSRIKSV